MSTRAIRLVTIGLILASGILSVGDKIASIPSLPGWLTSSWPVLLTLAATFKEIASLLWPQITLPVPTPEPPLTVASPVLNK